MAYRPRRRLLYRRRAGRPSEPIQRIGQFTAEAVDENIAQLIYTADTPVTFRGLRYKTAATGLTPWALVHVPDGYAPNQIVFPLNPNANLYEPSQNVLASGLQITDDLTVGRIFSRRLKPGDKVFMIFRLPSVGARFAYEVTASIRH